MSNSLELSVILKELAFKSPWNSRSQIFQSHLDFLNGFEHTSFNKAHLVTNSPGPKSAPSLASPVGQPSWAGRTGIRDCLLGRE